MKVFNSLSGAKTAPQALTTEQIMELRRSFCRLSDLVRIHQMRANESAKRVTLNR